MGKKIHTALLLFIVVFLLVTTVYVSFQLRQEPSLSGMTTVKKTKAASITYTKFINLAQPENTVIPTPTAELLAKADISPTVSTGAAIFNISETPIVSPSPTEVILAKISGELTPTTGNENNSGTKSANLSPTTKKLSSLPQTGWMQNTTFFFIIASAFILFSFIF